MTTDRALITKVSTLLSASALFLAVLTLLTMFAGVAIAQTIDPTTRTVTTTNFSVSWYTGNDTEAITNITWLGGQNLTNNQGIGTCWPSAPGSVEYFGNSYAPPDPWAGGLVLVGGGTTTPAGTTAWSGQILSSGTAQVIINSASTGCPPSSAGINVQTTYNFLNPEDSSTNYFGVQRAFDFSTTTFAHDFRPYMARLSLYENYTEVLYPDTSGALATVNVYACGLGCTGPVVIPDATLLSPPWDATQGWFAMHNPDTLQGVVIARSPSNDPQGNPIVVQLWVDNDEDADTGTNVSSFLLMSPTGGFTGGTVTEVETLCFYNSSIWTPSLTPPAPCAPGTPTTTTLTSTPNPSLAGQTVTFTATVTSASGTPAGTVLLYNGSTQVGSGTLTNGTTTIPVSTLPVGSDSITAAYQGNSTFAASTSSPLIQVVNGATSTTALTSSLNPSVYGQPVSFTANVSSSSGTPTGTVIFYSGSAMIGSGSLNASGQAAISVSSLLAGKDSITAAYQGSSTFAGSTSSPVIQTVNLATTSTSLTSSLNPAGTGQSVTFTATVSTQYGGAATGSVTFYSGSQSLGSGTLTGNIALLTTSFSTAGTYAITAQYAGDANNSGSTSVPVSQKIVASTTTTLTSSPNPSIYGQTITFTAAVTSNSGAPPNGETVTFYNGSAVLGTGALSGGVASFATSSLAAGVYSITAKYPGDSTFAASTSAVLRQVVNSTSKSATSTTLTSGLNPSIYGQAVTFTAAVTGTGSVPPTGTVTFIWSGTTLGTATLNSGGVATLTVSRFNADTFPVTATYGGDANNLGSTSPVLNQVVNQATSTATLTSSPNPSSVGEAVTFKAEITSPTAIAKGPVTFTAGNTVLGTVELSAKIATLTTSSLPAGSDAVTVTYVGDSDIKGSSASVTQVVGQSSGVTSEQ